MSRSGWLRKSTRIAVLFRGRFTCSYCGQKSPKVAMTLDHLKPGGGNGAENLVTACFSCNSSKKATSVYAFCLARGLNRATVMRRIRKQIEQPIGPYQTSAMEISRRGLPSWLADICAGKGAKRLENFTLEGDDACL